MKKLSVVGIDMAKQVFPLVGMDEQGTMLVRQRLYRAQGMAFAQFLAVWRRLQMRSMDTSRPCRGSRLYRRCALPRRGDTRRLRQI